MTTIVERNAGAATVAKSTSSLMIVATIEIIMALTMTGMATVVMIIGALRQVDLMIAERLQADSVVVVEGSVGGAEDEDMLVVVASEPVAICRFVINRLVISGLTTQVHWFR